MSFTITVSDQAVIDALNRLTAAVENPQSCLQALGEDIMERIKQRFEIVTGSDGHPRVAKSLSCNIR